MAEAPATNEIFEVVCPHCKKPFQAELIAGGAARYRGFKCPHCRLFVSAERVAEHRDSGPAA